MGKVEKRVLIGLHLFSASMAALVWWIDRGMRARGEIV